MVLHAGATYDFTVNYVKFEDNLVDLNDWEHYADKEYLIIHRPNGCGGAGTKFNFEVGFYGELRRDMRGLIIS